MFSLRKKFFKNYYSQFAVQILHHILLFAKTNFHRSVLLFFLINKNSEYSITKDIFTRQFENYSQRYTAI